MRNPFSVAPRCVQWAAVILIAIPIFNLVVSLNVTSGARLLTFWKILFVSTAIQVAYAVGLLFGMNLVRLLFGATFCYYATSGILTWSEQGFSSMSLVSSLTALIAPCISLVLVFLPPANRYFSSSHKQEPMAEKAEEQEPWAFWPIARIAVLLVLLIVGVPLVRYFRPALENASSMNQAQKGAYAKYQQDMQDLRIVENLRLLSQAQGQFSLEHPGVPAKYSDLVGPDRLIKRLTLAAGEKYPDVYVEGKEPVAILPDGTMVAYDWQAFKAKRTPPR